MTYTGIRWGGLIFILVIVFSQPARAFQNEPNDFRGIEWGTNYHELKGFTKVSTQDPLEYYTKKNEDMSMGDARLAMVVYVFYKKKLCGAVLDFKSPSNFQTIKAVLSDWYGKGYQANRYEDKYRWSGTNVSITLEYDDITQKGQVVYYFIPIYEIIQRAN
ncbi:MAG: hypothetical protein JW896_04590 [Deltaproteobacteria bacterium]|nr:hypothetical protein [Deltaproteobacteria bacterium]